MLPERSITEQSSDPSMVKVLRPVHRSPVVFAIAEIQPSAMRQQQPDDRQPAVDARRVQGGMSVRAKYVRVGAGVEEAADDVKVAAPSRGWKWRRRRGCRSPGIEQRVDDRSTTEACGHAKSGLGCAFKCRVLARSGG